MNDFIYKENQNQIHVWAYDPWYGTYTGELVTVRRIYDGELRVDVRIQDCITVPSTKAIINKEAFVKRKRYETGTIHNFNMDKIVFLNLQSLGDMEGKPMKEQAITKLRTEMEKEKQNSYVQVVGGFLMSIVESSDGAAEKIINTDKTISGSLDAMRKAAEKRKTQNYAILTDAEGFAVVLEYFGIKHGSEASTSYHTPDPIQAPKVQEDIFSVNLDDLL